MGSSDTFHVLFDAAHGQVNWAQTGFSSRQLNTNFAGLAAIFSELQCECSQHTGRRLTKALSGVDLLVIPPPTGAYNPLKESWRPQLGSTFSSDEILEISRFVYHGGRLLAFAYRFGDSFTQTNLCELFAGFGVLLNNDAVINLNNIRRKNPLQSQFVTGPDCLSVPWEKKSFDRVFWRSMATFIILPGAPAFPLAVSPGGRCIAWDRVFRQISFQSLPILVAGTHGRGRFVLCGGPHVFEHGDFGLLHTADNERLLRSVLRWLMTDEPVSQDTLDPRSARMNSALAKSINSNWQALCRLKGDGPDERFVNRVERQLRETGILRAIGRARWSA